VQAVTAKVRRKARQRSIVGAANQPGTRRRILDASLELLGERGFHGFGVREVADLAATTTGSMYYFFDDKHAALRAVVRSVAAASEPAWRRSFRLAMISESTRAGSPEAPPMAELLRAPILAAVAAGELVELFVESVIAAHRPSPAVRPKHAQVRS
jgi:AcrR family transcriptional regulator